MKPSDFARKSVGGAYLTRTDTLFDKALNQNGKIIDSMLYWILQGLETKSFKQQVCDPVED